MEILQKENKILRQIAKPVPQGKITTPLIQKIINGLKDAMYPVEDAVAIAAPQIGISRRIFVVSGVVFAPKKEEGASFKDYRKTWPPDLVFINPEIIKRSKEKESVEEGCLSVRWLYGDVPRFKQATIRAYDEAGRQFTRGASGLLAQIFQHEVDHLDGVLFTDKAKNVREVRPEKGRLTNLEK